MVGVGNQMEKTEKIAQEQEKLFKTCGQYWRTGNVKVRYVYGCKSFAAIEKQA